VAELTVPGPQTYLGTIVAAVRDTWAARADVTTRVVPQVTLDSVAAEHDLAPDLVKIDVEGSELAVLAGAQQVLTRARPLLVLESWPASPERPALFVRLASLGYQLYP
jgi:FkbM family methyltransferase